MALTNAERQAAHKERREEMMRALTEQNAVLLTENAALRAEIDLLKTKAHRLEISALKAELKRVEAAQSQPPNASNEKGGQSPPLRFACIAGDWPPFF